MPVPSPGRRPTTRSSSRSSIATATSRTASAWAAAPSASAAVRQGRLLSRRRPGRLQLHARHDGHAPRSARRLSALQGPEDLLRSSNGWGLITVPGGRTQLPRARRSSTPRASSSRARRRRRRHPLEYPVAELRVQRHHPLEQLHVQRRPARQQRHALRPGPARGRVDAVRLRRRRPANEVHDARDRRSAR